MKEGSRCDLISTSRLRLFAISQDLAAWIKVAQTSRQRDAVTRALTTALSFIDLQPPVYEDFTNLRKSFPLALCYFMELLLEVRRERNLNYLRSPIETSAGTPLGAGSGLRNSEPADLIADRGDTIFC